MANETSRPEGLHAPAPNAQWRIRLLVAPKERKEFQITVEALREDARKEFGCLPGIDPGPCTRAAIDRRALTRALIAHRYS